MSTEIRALLRAGIMGAGTTAVLAMMAGVLTESWLAMVAVLIVIAVVAAVVGAIWHAPLLEVQPQNEIPRPTEARDTLL